MELALYDRTSTSLVHFSCYSARGHPSAAKEDDSFLYKDVTPLDALPNEMREELSGAAPTNDLERNF